MSENKKTALDALPDLLFEIDETGRIYDYRALMPESLVVPPEEFLGKRMDEVLPPEPSRVIKLAIKETMDKGHHSGGTYSLQMPNGLRWYELSMAVKDKSDPDNVRLITLVRDITARKTSEKALAESEEIFRSLAQVTDALIFIYMNHQTVYANPAAIEVTGYSEDELLKIDFMEFIHPDFRQVVTERVQSRMAGKKQDSKLKLKIIRKDGEIRWLSYSSELVQYMGERAVLGTAFDITELKETEAALSLSEKQAKGQLNELETIYESIPVGLCLLDREFRVIRINEQLALLNGQPISKLLGASVREIIPDLAIRVEPILQIVFDTGKPALGIEISAPSHSDQGRTNHWVMSCYPAKVSDGIVQAVGVVITDLTQRKQTEELLRKMTEELRSEREELQKKNIALKEILFSLEGERQEFKSLICEDIQQAMTPFLEKLRRSVGEEGADEINRIGEELNYILSEDIDAFHERYASLTSREIDICSMIKEGMSSKEISDRLDLSVLTIHKHREQIRKKLGIANKKINLSTYLRLHI